MPNSKLHNRKFDLEERTFAFGKSIIVFAKKIPKNSITAPLINQLVRSGTSVGANYCEADDAHSRKDFKHKISICKKEARETKYWLKMISNAVPELKCDTIAVKNEAQELNLIFNAIFISTTKNDN